MKFKVGDRVCQRIKPFETDSPLKFGTITECYSKPRKIYKLPSGDSMVLGPYPELYVVCWDCGLRDRGLLPHALQLPTKKV